MPQICEQALPANATIYNHHQEAAMQLITFTIALLKQYIRYIVFYKDKINCN